MKITKIAFALSLAIIQSAAILCLPSTASAQDETWSVSAANWMQYWFFNEGDGQFLESRRDSLDNRFIVDFDLGDFYTGAWLNINQFNHPTQQSSEEMTQRYFGWSDNGLSIHLGNYYQVFDRGLTLNTFLDDAIYFDNNLDGVKVQGRFDKFEFDALSGRGLNSLTKMRDYTLRGARGAVRPIRQLKVGGSYVRFKQMSSDYSRTLNANLTSVNATVRQGPLELYGEYARKDGREDGFMPLANQNGDGTYLSGSVSFEKISVYSEYKNYVHLLYPIIGASFNNPPPASHQGRTLTALNSVPGERGYQVGTLISPTYDLNFDLSFSESFSRNIPDSLFRQYLAEKYAGMRWGITPELVLNYSWDRIDWWEEDETENYLDTYYYLSGTHVVSLTASSKRFFNRGPARKDYHENYLTLGYGIGNFIVISVGGSKSNNKETLDPDKLAFAEVTLRYGNNELIVFTGGERGGLICSSGICQTRPTFQGTRIVLFSRF